MKIKTSELIGSALDWAVAAALEGHAQETGSKDLHSGKHWVIHGFSTMRWDDWTPSTDWSQGGPIIESNQVFLDPPHDMHRANYDEKTGKVKGCWETYESWHATVSARVRTLPPKIEGFPGRVGRGEGETALIATCRAIVASVFGDEIEIQQEIAP